jgi:RNA polymerase sigma factor (sigma-70 family)
MGLLYSLDPLVQRLLPSHNDSTADRIQAWTDWFDSGGSAPVLKFIRWANGTATDDEEILQETLLVAFLKVEAGQYEHRGFPFSGFLKRIAWLKIMEASRQGSRQVSMESLPEESLPIDDSGHEGADLWKEEQVLKRALAALPVRRSRIVMLYERGYSTAEIAAHFGIQEALVRKEKSLGLRQLRQVMTPLIERAG